VPNAQPKTKEKLNINPSNVLKNDKKLNIGSSNNQNANFNSWNVEEPPKIEKSFIFLKIFLKYICFFEKRS